MNKNNPLSSLLALAILSAAMDGKRQRGEPVDDTPNFQKSPAELLDDPDFQAWAAARGISITESTPDCDCEMCVEINRRNALNKAQDEASNGRVKTVPDILREAAGTYEVRNPLYGDAYKHFGSVMMGLFPQGLYLNEVEDWNRLGVLMMKASKLSRYAANLTVGGHFDSALDDVVYSAMLAELTEKK